MDAATTTQPVLAYLAPDTLRQQREVDADGTIHLVVLPERWRSDFKLHALIACAYGAILCGLMVTALGSAAGGAPYPVALAILLSVLILIGMFVVWFPVNVLLCSLLVRRVITVSIGTNHVRVRWKRPLWTSGMSWRRDRIASVRNARVWRRIVWRPVTARDKDDRIVFTVSAPEPEDVHWLAENLRRELSVSETPS